MDGTLNLVVEIPKWSRAKLECATKEPLNPIKHDIKKKKLRNYEWGDLSWNYGFFPQTWENPEIKDIFTGYMGDGDPVDVVEIGQRCWPVGSVVRTKVLGAFALVDEGETDWKIIAISVVDPMAHQINDVDDIEVGHIRFFPSVTQVQCCKSSCSYRCICQDVCLRFAGGSDYISCQILMNSH